MEGTVPLCAQRIITRLCFLVLQLASCFHHVADVDDGQNEDGKDQRWGEPESGSYCSLATSPPKTLLYGETFVCKIMASFMLCEPQLSCRFSDLKPKAS